MWRRRSFWAFRNTSKRSQLYLTINIYLNISLQIKPQHCNEYRNAVIAMYCIYAYDISKTWYTYVSCGLIKTYPLSIADGT